MRLGGPARYLAHIASKTDLEEAVQWARQEKMPLIMIGGGANVIFQDKGFDGLVLINDIPGIHTEERGSDWIITVGAGEIWDDVVKQSVELHLTGIESLSLIPGKTGAAVVQNIGAYGQEVSKVIESVEAYDLKTNRFVTIKPDKCDFSYRASRFNRQDKGRFLITALTFRLHKGVQLAPFYKDVETFFSEYDVHDPQPADIRDAVCAIRIRKLPNPSEKPNCGSFFYNPIVSMTEFDEIIKKHPEINEAPPGWPQPPRWYLPDGNVKLSAARLMELCGYKAYRDKTTGMATWPFQTLVLINEKAQSTADLLAFRKKITDAVYKEFGVMLEQEPELIGRP